MSHHFRTHVVAGVGILAAAALSVSACGADVLNRKDPEASAPVTVTAPPATVTVTQSAETQPSTADQSEQSATQPTAPDSSQSQPSQPQQASQPPPSVQVPTTLDISTNQLGIPCENRDVKVHGTYIEVSFVGVCRSVSISGGYAKVIVTQANTVTVTSSSGTLSIKKANAVDVSKAGAYYTVNCGSTPQGHLIPVKKNPTKYQSFTRCLTSS